MQSLTDQIKQLQSFIPQYGASNTAVSNATVGWHINHCLLVCKTIADAISASDPTSFTRSYKLIKVLVFIFKKIPRGKGKAPKTVVPKTVALPEELSLLVENALQKISSLQKLEPNKYFEHPYFGNLNLEETITFLQIHTLHHLKIIADMVKK